MSYTSQTNVMAQCVHVSMATVVIVTTTMLEPLIKASASRLVTTARQGSFFGFLATLTGGGEAVGSILLTTLYSNTKAGWVERMESFLPPETSPPLVAMAALYLLMLPILYLSLSADHKASSLTLLSIPTRLDDKRA